MLNTVEFLLKHKNDAAGNFALLEKYYGIKSNFHPDDERVILNYSQIDAVEHKAHKITKECRGLVLNRNTYEVIARAFGRFFNLGEEGVGPEEFDWDDFQCLEKLDGSLILVYYWNDRWRVNTRNSFGLGLVGESEHTWRDLVLSQLAGSVGMVKGFTYVFELCSPYNNIVKMYDDVVVTLLSIFNYGKEASYDAVKASMLFTFAKTGVRLPDQYDLTSQDELSDLIAKIEAESPTNEGVVLRDSQNRRIKVKTASYVKLHRMFNNGNIRSNKSLLPIILEGEVDEVLSYWPTLKVHVDALNVKLDKLRKDLDNYWYVFGNEPSRKKFAIAVQKCKMSSLLFKARDKEVHPLTLFDGAQPLILKLLDKMK